MQTTANKKTGRIEWVDFVKGWTVLLVILGHTVGFDTPAGDITRGIIYTFHMPLFFILSAYTDRLSRTPEEYFRKTERSFLRLIVPAAVLFVLTMLPTLVKGHPLGRKYYVIESISTFIYASGVEVRIFDTEIRGLGLLWFLIALFFGRCLYDYLQMKLKGKALAAVSGILCLFGFVISRLQWLPFSLDIVLVVLPFFWFGHQLKKADMQKKAFLFCLLSLLLWGLLAALVYRGGGGYLELAPRKYPLFPLDLLAAAAGTMFWSYLGVLIGSGKLFKPLRYIGRNAMYMLWVQALDHGWEFLWGWTGNHFADALLRILTDLAVFLLFMGVLALIRKNRTAKKAV